MSRPGSRLAATIVCDQCSVNTRHVCQMCTIMLDMLRDHTKALGLTRDLLELHSKDLIAIQKDLLRIRQDVVKNK